MLQQQDSETGEAIMRPANPLQCSPHGTSGVAEISKGDFRHAEIKKAFSRAGIPLCRTEEFLSGFGEPLLLKKRNPILQRRRRPSWGKCGSLSAERAGCNPDNP